jgi:hypothetical protein
MIEKFELFELMYLMTLSTAEVCFTLAANVDLLYSLQTEKTSVYTLTTDYGHQWFLKQVWTGHNSVSFSVAQYQSAVIKIILLPAHT